MRRFSYIYSGGGLVENLNDPVILEQKGIEVEQIWSGSVQGVIGNDQKIVILNTRLSWHKNEN